MVKNWSHWKSVQNFVRIAISYFYIGLVYFSPGFLQKYNPKLIVYRFTKYRSLTFCINWNIIVDDDFLGLTSLVYDNLVNTVLIFNHLLCVPLLENLKYVVLVLRESGYCWEKITVSDISLLNIGRFNFTSD